MVKQNEQDLRVQYQDLTSQHWSYSSEQYAGGDNLLTAIARGWEIDQKVTLRRHWFAGMRCIEIFHFTIRRDDVVADMAVVGNPVAMSIATSRRIRTSWSRGMRRRCRTGSRLLSLLRTPTFR